MSDERPDVQQAREHKDDECECAYCSSKQALIDETGAAMWENWLPKLDAFEAAVRADSEAEIRRLREALEKVEHIARTEAGYFTAAEPMSFGDGCKTAYLNIVAQIMNALKLAADTGRPER